MQGAYAQALSVLAVARNFVFVCDRCAYGSPPGFTHARMSCVGDCDLIFLGLAARPFSPGLRLSLHPPGGRGALSPPPRPRKQRQNV